jgi:carbamate kinase
VSCAYLDYGTEDERPIGTVDAATVQSYLDSGEFGEGSMVPKMRACLRFVTDGGEAVIASIDEPEAALEGETGTVVQSSNNDDS